ncbi:MAG: DUF1343 domain-containing protein [Bacteroidetes bacterium]|nr:DUF1343 domain-containing protein [Bacteroidota bacterium]
MHKILLFISTVFALSSTRCPGSSGNEKIAVQPEVDTLHLTETQVQQEVVVGAERMNEYLPIIAGKKIALMVNQTSLVGKVHLVDTLHSIGADIRRIFAPEHGFRGDHSAGAHVDNSKDEKTGIAITSLYGNTKKPTPEMLKDVDVLIFDIQDVGVRFYTYISSMHYLMEACAEQNKKLIILDRPNPNGHYVDGPVLDLKYKSFVGMHPVPLVHGMTVGEFAQMINGEGWLKDAEKCELMIVKCANYNHLVHYKLPVRPSPNLPTMASVYLYPSLGLFEGTNVSVGRGTEKPFEMLGRPGLKQGNISFTPVSIPGVADHPKYENVTCSGFVLSEFANTWVLAKKRIYLDWLYLFYQSNSDTANTDYFLPVFTKLAGNEILQKQIENNTPVNEVYKSWEPGLEAFRKIRSKYLLYLE